MSDFERWMREVDREVRAISGVSVHDLADCPFRDWFEDGESAQDAAQMALENEGW